MGNTQKQWFVVLSDQGRTDDVESFLTKGEAMAEVRWYEDQVERNPGHWYHLANPSWSVECRDVVVSEHDYYAWAGRQYPNGW